MMEGLRKILLSATVRGTAVPAPRTGLIFKTPACSCRSFTPRTNSLPSSTVSTAVRFHYSASESEERKLNCCWQFNQLRKRTFTKMATPTIKLNSGYDMPLVGFGLWKVNNDTCADQVYEAIKAGYRLFDGACGR